MLLRNYDNILAMHSLPAGTGLSTNTDQSTFGDGHLNVKDLSGNIKQFYIEGSTWGNPWLPFQNMVHSSGSNIIPSDTYDGTSRIIAGSGSTEVTYDDFRLESAFSNTQVNNATTGITYSALVYNEDANTWERTITITIIALQDLVVNEIGIRQGAKIKAGTGGTYQTLVWREVLDEPVPVPADGTFKVSLTISIAANSNKPADYSVTVTAE